MKVKNSLTVDLGQIVIVQKDYDSVVFESIEDFNYHVPEYAGKLEPWNDPDAYMFYCIEQKHWSDIRNGEHIQTQQEDFEPNQDWDDIIEMFETIKARQLDIYYGLEDAAQMSVANKVVSEMTHHWLRRTDFTLLVDSPLSQAEKDQMIEFRNFLRGYTDGRSLEELKATTEETLLKTIDASIVQKVYAEEPPVVEDFKSNNGKGNN